MTESVKNNPYSLLYVLILIGAAFAISCIGIQSSGALWPDSPLYLNAALMFRDWLQSDLLFHPYEFATLQYAQYPAFHVPFHPPVYPGLLSIWFLAFGPSYVSARIFIALCFAVAGCLFYVILGRLGVSRRDAFFSSLLMLTFPELAMWARDTVSEVPALALQFAATYFFIRWLDERRLLFCFIAFLLAEGAFLSRVSSVAILPIWTLIAVLGGRIRTLISVPFLACAATFLALNIAWISFVARFARFELGQTPAAEKLGRTLGSFITHQSQALIFYLINLPSMVGVVTCVLVAISLIVALRSLEWRVSRVFWLSWFAGAVALVIALGAIPERRYFVFVLPAFAALIAGAVSKNKMPGLLAPALISVAIITNAYQILSIPRGVIGYEPISKYLAQGQTPGNVLSVTWQGQDLIYRYQASHPSLRRDIIRGDRTLAIRLSHYGGVSGGLEIPAVQIVSTDAEFLEVVRTGKARYLVTYLPENPNTPMLTSEMTLAHKLASSMPSEFALVMRNRLTSDFADGSEHGEVFLWEYLKQLPDGPNQLPVVIPTAGIEMRRTP